MTMGEQCKARHPATGLRCERNDDHNHQALASERGTHRAELPPERPGFATTQPVVRVVSW
jgi:hypothetical protein